MTARSHDTHFLSFRKQQMAIPRGKRRMALSNPRRVKLFIIWISLETYRPIGVKEVSISLPQYVHWFLETTSVSVSVPDIKNKTTEL